MIFVRRGFVEFLCSIAVGTALIYFLILGFGVKYNSFLTPRQTWPLLLTWGLTVFGLNILIAKITRLFKEEKKL